MAATASKGGKKSSEEVFAGFQALRVEQRQLAGKISELELDLNEHKVVLETLRGVPAERACFQLVGGVLLRRAAGTVLPALQDSLARLPRALAALHDQLSAKGQEINRYVELHDIRLQRGDRAPPAPAPAAAPAPANVLVAAD